MTSVILELLPAMVAFSILANTVICFDMIFYNLRKSIGSIFGIQVHIALTIVSLIPPFIALGLAIYQPTLSKNTSYLGSLYLFEVWGMLIVSSLIRATMSARIRRQIRELLNS